MALWKMDQLVDQKNIEDTITVQVLHQHKIQQYVVQTKALGHCSNHHTPEISELLSTDTEVDKFRLSETINIIKSL